MNDQDTQTMVDEQMQHQSHMNELLGETENKLQSQAGEHMDAMAAQSRANEEMLCGICDTYVCWFGYIMRRP